MARAGELLVLAAALAWAAFDCWQRNRYKEAMLAILLVCITVGVAGLAFYEANSN